MKESNNSLWGQDLAEAEGVWLPHIYAKPNDMVPNTLPTDSGRDEISLDRAEKKKEDVCRCMDRTRISQSHGCSSAAAQPTETGTTALCDENGSERLMVRRECADF